MCALLAGPAWAVDPSRSPDPPPAPEKPVEVSEDADFFDPVLVTAHRVRFKPSERMKLLLGLSALNARLFPTTFSNRYSESFSRLARPTNTIPSSVIVAVPNAPNVWIHEDPSSALHLGESSGIGNRFQQANREGTYVLDGVVMNDPFDGTASGGFTRTTKLQKIETLVDAGFQAWGTIGYSKLNEMRSDRPMGKISITPTHEDPATGDVVEERREVKPRGEATLSFDNSSGLSTKLWQDQPMGFGVIQPLIQTWGDFSHDREKGELWQGRLRQPLKHSAEMLSVVRWVTENKKDPLAALSQRRTHLIVATEALGVTEQGTKWKAQIAYSRDRVADDFLSAMAYDAVRPDTLQRNNGNTLRASIVFLKDQRGTGRAAAGLDLGQSLLSYESGYSGPPLSKITSQCAGLFLQREIAAGEHLSVTYSTRADWYDDSEATAFTHHGRLRPSLFLGGVYRINSRLALTGWIGNMWRRPLPAELFGAVRRYDTLTEGDSTLRDERKFTAQCGLRMQPKANQQTELSLWLNRRKDPISDRDGAGLLQVKEVLLTRRRFANEETAKEIGVKLTHRQKFNERWSCQWYYRSGRATMSQSGGNVPNRSVVAPGLVHNSAAIQVDWRQNEAWGISTGVRWQEGEFQDFENRIFNRGGFTLQVCAFHHWRHYDLFSALSTPVGARRVWYSGNSGKTLLEDGIFQMGGRIGW